MLCSRWQGQCHTTEKARCPWNFLLLLWSVPDHTHTHTHTHTHGEPGRRSLDVLRVYTGLGRFFPSDVTYTGLAERTWAYQSNRKRAHDNWPGESGRSEIVAGHVISRYNDGIPNIFCVGSTMCYARWVIALIGVFQSVCLCTRFFEIGRRDLFSISAFGGDNSVSKIFP